MKKQKLYAGIDLHGNNLVIALVDETGGTFGQTRLPCDMYGVEKYFKPYKSRLAGICVESTFNWYWLVDGLEDLGYPVRLANPAKIQQFNGLKHSDDKSDALFLAEMLRMGILPTGYIYDRRMRPVRDLFRRRMLLVSKRTSLILSLRSLYTRTKGRALPLAQVKSMSSEDLADLFSHPADQLVAEIEKRQIDSLTQSIEEMEKMAMAAAREIPQFANVKTLPGIGDVLGMTIAMEVGGIERFPTAEDFASYCRTVPSIKITNGKKKGENNRKNGNRYLAWAFVEAAHMCRRYDEDAQRWYDRKAAKTNKIIATKAMACKLAKAAWHVMKEGTTYDPKRLFGQPARGEATPPKQSGRVSVNQGKGLKKKSPGLIGVEHSPAT